MEISLFYYQIDIKIAWAYNYLFYFFYTKNNTNIHDTYGCKNVVFKNSFNGKKLVLRVLTKTIWIVISIF